MKLSTDGIFIIKYFESCKLNSYKCSAGKWTIGYGHTGADVRPGMVITKGYAEGLLANDITVFEQGVSRLVKVPLFQHQFDALVVFAFNAGVAALQTSTLLRKLNATDFAGAAEEFLRWNKADGTRNGKDDDGDGLIDEAGEKQVLLGLKRRRLAERARFLNHSGDESVQIALANS